MSAVFDCGALRDGRLAETKGVNTPWTLRKCRRLEEWTARAAHIRRQILTSLGLWPLPEKDVLNWITGSERK